MGYRVTYSKSTVKTILKYDKPTRERVYSALDSLPKGDIKRIKGQAKPPYFRLRVGKLRALFIKDDNAMEIFVFDVNFRGDIYK